MGDNVEKETDTTTTATAPTNNNNNQDELILEQQRSIEKEVRRKYKISSKSPQKQNPFQISDSIALIGDLETISVLESEYGQDAVYKSKVKDLGTKYKGIRRIRPDGNCFFRAFAYSYLEHLSQHRVELAAFQELGKTSKDTLIRLGFPSFTLEDFQAIFMEVVDRVAAMPEDQRPGSDTDLHKVFNDAGYSDYVVVYLRLVTSGQIQENAVFYQDFIGGYASVEEFRHQEVEPMYKESDHIHIIALCNALGVGVRVEYMDRGGDGSEVKAHDFPEDKAPSVFLLYRPGHYDILYPNDVAVTRDDNDNTAAG